MRMFLIVAGATGLFGLFGGGDHVAHVAYREGDKTLWKTWSTTSREECNAKAVAEYNRYFREGRAVDWYCMHDGERYR